MVKILYADDDVFIIDKPSGMTVNKADTTTGEMTVQEWIEDKFPIFLQRRILLCRTNFSPNEDFYRRAGIVHRLDKETSGVMIIAKSLEAFVELQRQFKERIVKKTYVALVHGRVVPSEGEVRVPVGRLPWNRKQFGVIAGGREAVTKYKAIQNLEFRIQNQREQMTLLELHPETGRTHQIRVHLKYIGHPIFADFLYAGRKTQRSDRKVLSRVFLHAAKISFHHPKSGELVTFESPLPEELEKILNYVPSPERRGDS